MAIALDGRSLAGSLRRELKAKVALLDITPTLAVVLVGDDPASHLYVSLKEKAAAEVGLAVTKVLLPATATQAAVLAQVERFNQEQGVDAILVQLPLPPGLDEQAVIAAMDARKDADGFHPDNLKRFLAGQPAVSPGVSQGIVRLIELAGQRLEGKKATLVVNSREFAQPLIKLLGDRGVQVTVLEHPEPAPLRISDIIVVAVGQPGAIGARDVKDGAIVIDVGTTRVSDRVVGDVAADELRDRPVYLTPVPGGVGPMTVAMLLWNVYRLATQRRPRPA